MNPADAALVLVALFAAYFCYQFYGVAVLAHQDAPLPASKIGTQYEIYWRSGFAAVFCWLFGTVAIIFPLLALGLSSDLMSTLTAVVGAAPFLCASTLLLFGEPRLLLPASRRGHSVLAVVIGLLRTARPSKH